MRRRNWIILSCIMAALLIAMGIWNFREKAEKEAIMISAENNYQQSFHDLTYYVDSLEESLGNSLAMETRDSMRPQLVDAWRLSALAHGAANTLPLTLLPFNRTNEFLAHVGEFAYNTGIKTTEDRPLSENEYKNLQKLYKESMSIRDGLRDVQQKVMDERLRWMDVETQLKNQDQNQDNQVIDGMKKVDGQATEYTQSFSPENPRNVVMAKKQLKPLTGSENSEDSAVQQLKKWIGQPNAEVRDIRKTGKGANVDAYEITLQISGQKAPLHASVTKKGAHVIWFINDRQPGRQKISLYEASKKAKQFLETHGMNDFELVKKDQFDAQAVLTFVQKKKNIRIYPASIKMKVAMDDGAVIGFDQTDLLFVQCDKVPLTPKLPEKEARSKLNHHLKVQENHLAVFQNTNQNLVLCYEYFATRDQDTYRVLINAENGDQEKVELLRN